MFLSFETHFLLLNANVFSNHIFLSQESSDEFSITPPKDDITKVLHHSSTRLAQSPTKRLKTTIQKRRHRSPHPSADPTLPSSPSRAAAKILSSAFRPIATCKSFDIRDYVLKTPQPLSITSTTNESSVNFASSFDSPNVSELASTLAHTRHIGSQHINLNHIATRRNERPHDFLPVTRFPKNHLSLNLTPLLES